METFDEIIFTKPKSLVSLDQATSKLSDHLLPEDLHIRSIDFFGLFMKPGYSLKLSHRVEKVGDSKTGEITENTNEDALFWSERDSNINTGLFIHY